jgi:predicted RNA binding protein YcfA (HicA-like mRNA interferase family)
LQSGIVYGTIKQRGGMLLSQIEKLLQRIKNNPKTVRFGELEKVLQKAGFKCRQPKGGSSHYTYTNPGNPMILTVPHKEPYVKEFYVKLVIKALEEKF